MFEEEKLGVDKKSLGQEGDDGRSMDTGRAVEEQETRWIARTGGMSNFVGLARPPCGSVKLTLCLSPLY